VCARFFVVVRVATLAVAGDASISVARGNARSDQESFEHQVRDPCVAGGKMDLAVATQRTCTESEPGREQSLLFAFFFFFTFHPIL